MYGLKEAYGELVAATKVKTCKFYFKNDARTKLSKVGDAYREEFLNIFKIFCKVATVPLYILWKSRLGDTATLFPALSSWIQWWDARKYHVFPAFRKFGFSKSKYAKMENAGLKCEHKMMLVDPAKNDVSSKLCQEKE